MNKDLSVIEKVRRFILADEPFTVDNEMLTPSIKIRRHVIKEKYGERLDALYKSADRLVIPAKLNLTFKPAEKRDSSFRWNDGSA